ncbi:hypothetical protein [uncultured Maricaulis sp.]|uniref:hypothetical protein n=1 Tax=uncultured Maricaulis sp. TaxID=174710 RepID=UPI0026307663|nr:hypothetical protein [uncultured Maricaulis sp.]
MQVSLAPIVVIAATIAGACAPSSSDSWKDNGEYHFQLFSDALAGSDAAVLHVPAASLYEKEPRFVCTFSFLDDCSDESPACQAQSIAKARANDAYSREYVYIFAGFDDGPPMIDRAHFQSTFWRLGGSEAPHCVPGERAEFEISITAGSEDYAPFLVRLEDTANPEDSNHP